MGLTNMLCWICHNVTQDICWGLCGAPELRPYASKCCSIAMNLQASVTYCDTATQYWLKRLFCQMVLANMQCLICCNETHDRSWGFPIVPESGRIMLFPFFWLHSIYVASCFQCTSNWQLTNDSKPFNASCPAFDLGNVSQDRPAENVYCSIASDFISYWSSLIIKNANYIPL